MQTLQRKNFWFPWLVILWLVGCNRAELPSPTITPIPATPTLRSPELLTPTPTLAIPEPTLTPLPLPSLTSTPNFVVGDDSIGDPFTPELGNTGYEVQHYRLQLAIDPATTMISGRATLDILTTLPDLGRLSLDFVGFEVSEVMVDGVPTGFSRNETKLYLDFTPPILLAGTLLQIEIAYSGRPVQADSPYIHYADYLGLTFPGNNTFYVLSEPDGARYWFPCNDHPLDKATYQIELTVPAGLAAIANGQLVNSYGATMPNGSNGSTFVWEHNYPMATYLALAAAGHYIRAEGTSPAGVPLLFYFFPEFQEDYEEVTDITGEAIDWFSQQYGPYPFESYGQATTYALGASMEAQTMTLLSYQMFNEQTVVHEIAHAWFGNWVTPENWDDVWINEGFATYSELLWLSRTNPLILDEKIAEITGRVNETGHDYPLDQPPTERLLSFDAYYRSTLMIHALRLEMGDEAFFNALRTYLARYGGGNAGQDELRAVMEEVSGRDFDPFFANWLSGN